MFALLAPLIMPIINALGGQVVGGLVDSYKAKLAAVNSADEHAIDLAKADLMAQIEARKQAVALAGIPSIAHAQAAALWMVIIYLIKAVLWDKVVGSFVGCSGHTTPGACGAFTTDQIDGVVAVWVGLVISWAFGGQIVSNVVNTVARRFGK